MSKTDHARTRKTPRQRAEEALGVAQRRVAKLTKDRDKLARDLKDVEGALEVAERRRVHLSQSPDLDDPAQMVLPSDDAEGV